MSSILILATIAVIFGLFFRVHAVDRKIYGFDETATQLRVAGRTLPTYERDLRANRFDSLDSIRTHYQLVQPASRADSTIRSLVIDDPQHAPLYFLLERQWQAVGTSISAWRSLGVLIGLVLLPITWWLAFAGFDRESALVFVALIAVSPFHVLFAQYNREYGLWTVFTALSSAMLLVCLGRPSSRTWVGYGLSLVAGLYTDPLFAYVIVAHAAFMAYDIAFRRGARKNAYGFAIAAVIAVVAYVPWLLVIFRQWHIIKTETAWNGVALPLKLLVSKWAFEIGNVFFDAEYEQLRYIPIVFVVLVVVAVAAARAIAKERRTNLGIAISLVVVPALPLVLGDLLFHESRSTAARYLTPVWLGLELLVAVGLSSWMRSSDRRHRALGTCCFAVLVAGGIFSLARSGASTFWWIDTHDAPLVPIARELDARPGSTLCYVDNSDIILTLSDEVTAPISIRNATSLGCFAVATKSEIASVETHGLGRFQAVGHGVFSSDTEAIHAGTGSAHGMVYEEPQLWQLMKSS